VKAGKIIAINSERVADSEKVTTDYTDRKSGSGFGMKILYPLRGASVAAESTLRE
jgi:hypothetical protein